MPSTDIPSHLRRRRAASYRCPVLADGRRDPLALSPKRRCPITVRVLGRWSVEADGPGVVDILDRLGSQRMRSRAGGMWQFPSRHLEDFLVLAEHLGYVVEETL